MFSCYKIKETEGNMEKQQLNGKNHPKLQYIVAALTNWNFTIFKVPGILRKK